MWHFRHRRFNLSIWGALLTIILNSLFTQPGAILPAQASTVYNAAASAITACPTGKSCLFLPTIGSDRPMVDLVLDNIEVTQAVQDELNNVPLVAGRPAVLRVYARYTGSTRPLNDVRVTVSAVRAGNTLSGGPLLVTKSIPLTADRSSYESSVNFAIPGPWLSGQVELTVRLDPENVIPEANEKNNTVTRRLGFSPVPALKIMVVPVQYSHTPNSITYLAPTQDTISDWIRRVYPVSRVDVTWHAPYQFTGNLSTSSDWGRLLNEITTLRSSEGAPASTVYYGLVPTADCDSAWFRAGIAGIGWIGLRAAVGLDIKDQAGEIAAHEIGHNLGLLHAPCGSVGSADSEYPYTNGSIGQYGLDVYDSTLYDPSKAKDVMSYCYPKWVSDYTYRELYEAQVATGALTAPSLLWADSASRALMVRAELGEVEARLLPSYLIHGQAVAPQEAGSGVGDYSLQLLGPTGEILATVPLPVYEQVIEGDGTQAIHALVPIPDQPAAHLRLLQGDQVLAEQSIRVITTDKLNGVLVEPIEDGYRVRWSAIDQPALVRYSSDSGKTWTTLGVDLIGGEMSIRSSDLPAPGGTFDVVLSDTWK